MYYEFLEQHEEEDDKPRPPEDDSVPDMEDSFTTDGVGHDEVEEYINNNISNDEVCITIKQKLHELSFLMK